MSVNGNLQNDIDSVETSIESTGEAIKNAHPEHGNEVNKLLETQSTSATMDWVKKGAEGLSRHISSDKAIAAMFIGDALRGTAEAGLTASRVFSDKESSPQEKTASVLRCISSFSMLLAVLGPTGLVGGTVASVLLGIITVALEATSPERESIMDKLEKLLRDFSAEGAETEVRTAQGLLKTQYSVVQSFKDNSKSWDSDESILATAPITSDISQFMLIKTVEWLRDPRNTEHEKWEEVFFAYAETVIEVLSLQLTMLTKLRVQDKGPMLAYIQEYGTQMESWFGDLMPIADGCGDYYHTTSHYWYGMKNRNPWQPPRPQGGWQDMNIGRVRSFCISPRTDRIWIGSDDGKRPLMTGRPGDVLAVGEETIAGCLDVDLLPWAGEDADVLLVTSTGEQLDGPGRLSINSWHEKRSRFFTTEELRNKTENGFVKEWYQPKISGGAIVMARAFSWTSSIAKPPRQDHVYIVQRTEDSSKGPSYSLGQVRWTDLQPSNSYPIDPVWIALPDTEGLPFRISSAKHFLYLFTRRQAWRIKHELTFTRDPGQWETVTMPASLTNPDDGLWHEQEPDWWSHGINDLHAWADDHLVCVLNGTGEMWAGDLEKADQRKWEEYHYDYSQRTGVESLPQAGRSLIVIAQINGKLHFRVFDAGGKIIVETQEGNIRDVAGLTRLRALLALDDTYRDKKTENIVQAATLLIGSAWQWKQIYGGARRVMKKKHPSFNYCRELHLVGRNFKAGRTNLPVMEKE